MGHNVNEERHLILVIMVVTDDISSCVWRTVSSQSSHHPQEVLLAQFSLYVHKGGLKPDSFHFCHGSQCEWREPFNTCYYGSN